MKATVTASANLAFIKYWGQADHAQFIPRNNSISMCLDECQTTTTIEASPTFAEDVIEIKFWGQEAFAKLDTTTIKGKNILDQVNRIRMLANSKDKIHFRTVNNFPADAGIASSASGSAALTAALVKAYALDTIWTDKTELSRLTRLAGSVSGVRSVLGGFVEQIAGHDHNSSIATQIADEHHWDLVDTVAVVDSGTKLASSSAGHLLADTSPYFETRLKEMQPRIKTVRAAILSRDIKTLGLLIERESTSMHTVMMTSVPPLFYWAPGSIAVIKDVMRWRQKDGLQVYFSLDAGANVHCVSEAKDAAEVEKRLKANPFVRFTIQNHPGPGVQGSDQHLF